MADTKQFILPSFQSLQKEYDASVRCNRCGFCETVCPTYMLTGKEIHSPRGRNQAFRQILEGKILNPHMASEVFSTCLTCHACTSVCFSQVPVGKLMAHAKAIAETGKKPSWLIFLRQGVMRFLLRHRFWISFFLWPIILLKNFGLSGLLNSIGLLKIISPKLAKAESICPKVPLFLKPVPSGKNQAKKVHYFSGCGAHFLYPNVVHSIGEVLNKTAIVLRVQDHPCCGLILNSAGDVEGARILARENVRLYSDSNCPILIDDDSCYGFMKGYGELLGGDPSAVQFSKRVKNLPEILLEEKIDFGFTQHSKVTVTCHDSCQVGNAYGLLDPQRNVLKNLKWVNFVEMEESTWCCGGAGAYCLKHPDMAEDILERKIKNIEGTLAQVVIAGASSCLMHMRYGIRKKKLEKKFEILHLSELLKRSMVPGTG